MHLAYRGARFPNVRCQVTIPDREVNRLVNSAGLRRSGESPEFGGPLRVLFVLRGLDWLSGLVWLLDCLCAFSVGYSIALAFCCFDVGCGLSGLLACLPACLFGWLAGWLLGCSVAWFVCRSSQLLPASLLLVASPAQAEQAKDAVFTLGMANVAACTSST